MKGMLRALIALGVFLVPTWVLAAPALRFTVDQRGDFVILGNTSGHDCANGVPAPVVGAVGNCGTNAGETSPDVFWRSDAPAAGGATANTTVTAAAARSTAILRLPAAATVSYARLYWSAARSGATTDTTVTIDRVGAGAFAANVTADDSATATSTHTYYQSTADITALVQANGAGAYRISDIDSIGLTNLNDNRVYVAWTMVVFYRLDTDPPRNLTLFDGLDIIEPTRPMASVTLSGFLVPNAGFDAKLGVVSYEGDERVPGDSLSFNGTQLSNPLNPATNFFNSTHSNLGVAVSSVGDLPQLTGQPRSMSGYDQDVVDVKSLVKAGDDKATIDAATTSDFYVLGVFVTSISTFKPDFSSTSKMVRNVTRMDNTVRPGDTLEYTVTTSNSGNDPGTGVVMTDALPIGVTFVAGSIRVSAGANAGAKTDVAGDDQGEFDVATRTVRVRLGTGASATTGGTMAVGATTTVVFRVTIDATAGAMLANQAIITAGGQSGAPPAPYPSDGNGPMPGSPPTTTPVDRCGADGDCQAPQRFCLQTTHPFTCSECRTRTDCPAGKPICDLVKGVCGACMSNNECAAPTPFCGAGGICVACRTSADCSGGAPVCDTATGTCRGCRTDADCPTATPACQPAGGCGECSVSNATRCVGAKPQCLTDFGLCACTDRDGDSECGGAMSGVVCSGAVGICVPGCSDMPMRNGCPGGQTCMVPGGGALGMCTSAVCANDQQCMAPRPKCDTAATPRRCVQCLADGDCTAPLICDTTGLKTCVECVPGKTAACTAAGAGARCLPSETCGCQTDADCGGAQSGRICDTGTSKCTFGCRVSGGNACPMGQTCLVASGGVGRCGAPSPDAGADGRDGAISDRPVTSTDARDGQSATTDAPASTIDAAASDAAVPSSVGAYVAGGGCRCETGHAARPTSGAWLLLVAGVLLLRRRR